MEIQVSATYDKDSKRFYRFLIDVGQEIIGNLYVPKGKEVPDSVIVKLKTKGSKT